MESKPTEIVLKGPGISVELTLVDAIDWQMFETLVEYIKKKGCNTSPSPEKVGEAMVAIAPIEPIIKVEDLEPLGKVVKAEPTFVRLKSSADFKYYQMVTRNINGKVTIGKVITKPRRFPNLGILWEGQKKPETVEIKDLRNMHIQLCDEPLCFKEVQDDTTSCKLHQYSSIPEVIKPSDVLDPGDRVKSNYHGPLCHAEHCTRHSEEGYKYCTYHLHHPNYKNR